MKQIIIFLLLIIVILIGYGKYNQYKRYNSPKVNYTSSKTVDLEHYNQDIVLKYYESVEELNSYVMLQWSANNIDVRTPEDDDNKTKIAVKTYAKKLAVVKYYEDILSKSSELKSKGLTNIEIEFLDKNGIDLKTYNKNLYKNKLITLFKNTPQIKFGSKHPIVYEIQKILIKKGYKLELDGVYKKVTFNIIKNFETKNNFLSDGVLDLLTLEALLK
ncbi:peptidoglycan-binding protein [uncultured Polaribacter sp.]|uniref:peptidoglycan-binding domain-containing protein n=1 Tax=uncultured Polaribacter sp. TaxID=174711 RepID=UPI00263616DD|nr:peptidoglycan-binding protein [uncultured Polaribacter sp.]